MKNNFSIYRYWQANTDRKDRYNHCGISLNLFDLHQHHLQTCECSLTACIALPTLVLPVRIQGGQHNGIENSVKCSRAGMLVVLPNSRRLS